MWSCLLYSHHAYRACRGLECTGTLIGPKHVVTAAHCVFDINDSRQYVSSLNFSPGESSDSSLPFGTDQWSSVRVLSQFTSQASRLCQPCRAHTQVSSGQTATPDCHIIRSFCGALRCCKVLGLCRLLRPHSLWSHHYSGPCVSYGDKVLPAVLRLFLHACSPATHRRP